VKKLPGRRRSDSPALKSGSSTKQRALKKFVRELRAILVESGTILNDLALNPEAEIVRGLCSRYQVLQENFALRYQEARACAIAALGSVEATFFFPPFLEMGR
jgi:hypothetical protein